MILWEGLNIPLEGKEQLSIIQEMASVSRGLEEADAEGPMWTKSGS